MPSRLSPCFWLIVCCFGFSFSLSNLAEARPARTNSKPSPAAQIPIEPFSADTEVLDRSDHVGAKLDESSSEQNLPRPAFEKTAVTGDELALALRVQMAREGFGGQLRLVEYTSPWFGLSQTLRYFDNEASDRLYEQRYGFYMGLALQPWRMARLSPFATLEGGWDRYVRDEQGGKNLDLLTAELAGGLKLRMNRVSSFALQWTEVFYPRLEAPLYPQQSSRNPRHASVEVFLNMNWETVL